MEAIEAVSSSSKQARSETCGLKPGDVGPGFQHVGSGEEFHGLMDVPPETGSSFTALLQLPANQAVELLVHSTVAVDTPTPPPPPAPVKLSSEVYGSHRAHAPPLPIFPSDAALVDRAAKFSVFASSENSPESSCSKQQAVKQEPLDSDSSPAASDPTVKKPSNKRKDKEKKAKESNKKSKKAANGTSAEDNGGEKLPYVHVRARRGQATDSHSLAERARREKINARMKLLQELVPGCNKISGTASVLDEIINHVQSLQRQVEFLSMRLAAVNPMIDFNLDSFLAAENGSPVGSNIPSMVMPSVLPEGQINGIRPQYQQLWHPDAFHQPVWFKEENSDFIVQETSLLSYDSSGNSASLRSNQLKMEL